MSVRADRRADFRPSGFCDVRRCFASPAGLTCGSIFFAKKMDRGVKPGNDAGFATRRDWPALRRCLRIGAFRSQFR
jgi:hypothetical protein